MQFKSRNVIAEMARLLTEDPHLESFEWNYFGEQHGKGEVDGAGGTVKCMLRRWHIREENQDKQTAAQLVENLASGAVGGTTTTRRNFFEFPEVIKCTVLVQGIVTPAVVSRAFLESWRSGVLNKTQLARWSRNFNFPLCKSCLRRAGASLQPRARRNQR
eukprot:12305326-Prorocentrum_lima.AAC.1